MKCTWYRFSSLFSAGPEDFRWSPSSVLMRSSLSTTRLHGSGPFDDQIMCSGDTAETTTDDTMINEASVGNMEPVARFYRKASGHAQQSHRSAQVARAEVMSYHRR